MSKICTNIEQSKKLSELGLSHETADMIWLHDFNGDWEIDLRINVLESLLEERQFVYAWSIGALTGLINQLNLSFIEGQWRAEHRKEDGQYIHCDRDNIVDAVYKIVEYLLTRGYIKTEKKEQWHALLDGYHLN